MNKTLVVLRHAKSNWDKPVQDSERALNERGRRGATAVGNWLRSETIEPDEIICSSVFILDTLIFEWRQPSQHTVRGEAIKNPTQLRMLRH